MTIQEVVKNLNELEKELLSLSVDDMSTFPPTPFSDIEEYLAPDKEVAKAIIRSKNPKLRKRDVDKMVEGLTQSVSGLESQYFPISENSSPLEEARSTKSEVRKAFKSLIIESKKIGTDIKDAGIMIINAIPSIAVMISAPPWNIPAAIIQVLLIVRFIKEILLAFFKIINYIAPLSKIGLVVSDSNLSKVLRVINLMVVFLLRILNPFKEILGFINKLLDFLKRRQGDDCDKQRRRIERQLTKKRRIRNRKQRKLNRNDSPANKWIKNNNQNWKDFYFQVDTDTEIPFSFAERLTRNDINPDENNPDNEDFIDLLDDWDDLNEELKTLELQLQNVCLPVDQNIQDSINRIETETTNIESTIGEITTSLSTYTVKFPDGTIRRGVTQDELDELREIYDLEFRNSFDIDFGSSTPSSSQQSNSGSSES